MSCIYEVNCERQRRSVLILNIASLRYKTVLEVLEMLNSRGDNITGPKLRDIMEDMVKRGNLHSAILDYGARGVKPVGYRNARMMKKIRRQ